MQRTAIALALFSLLTACGGGAKTTENESGSPGDGGTGSKGSASLSWTAPLENSDGTSLQDLIEFRVYKGTSTSRSSFQRIATISNPSVSVFLVENLPAGSYYFAVTAVNSQNVESSFSNVAQITIQ